MGCLTLCLTACVTLDRLRTLHSAIFQQQKKWECYHLSALGMKSQRGHSVQQMLAFNICPQGGLGGEYDWLLPLAHISFNFASLLPMS